MKLSRLLPPAILGALVLAGGASAGGPRFALFDVHTGLAGPSHNTYGDVKVSQQQAGLAARARGATLVRCASDCTFGPGWLAFSGGPGLAGADVVTAKARRATLGWGVVLTLTRHGWSSWNRFSRQAARSGATRGVPDALALVLNGTIVAQPLASQVRQGKTTVEIPGLSRANARRAAKLLSR